MGQDSVLRAAGEAMTGRALTPEQKRVIVERIYAAWCKKPSLRLGQFLVVATNRVDMFDYEDEGLAVAAEDLAEWSAPEIPTAPRPCPSCYGLGRNWQGPCPDCKGVGQR